MAEAHHAHHHIQNVLCTLYMARPFGGRSCVVEMHNMHCNTTNKQNVELFAWFYYNTITFHCPHHIHNYYFSFVWASAMLMLYHTYIFTTQRRYSRHRTNIRIIIAIMIIQLSAFGCAVQPHKTTHICMCIVDDVVCVCAVSCIFVSMRHTLRKS